jgi:hypothetical protein
MGYKYSRKGRTQLPKFSKLTEFPKAKKQEQERRGASEYSYTCRATGFNSLKNSPGRK